MADAQDIKNAQTNGNSAGSAAQAASTDQALSRINRDLEEKAARERAHDLKLPYIDVAVFPINPDILHLIPPEAAKKGNLIPFFKVGKNIKLAAADPDFAETEKIIGDLQNKGFKVDLHLASSAAIADAMKLYASDQYKLEVEVKNVVREEEINYEKELQNLAGLREKISALPAEEALNLLHVSAIKAGASDIHYQPEEKNCTVRFRIDGVLHTAFEISKEAFANLANQLKYKAKMKLNVTTAPQDGRFRFIVNERNIDVRVSAIPTEYGESFVCRILDSGKHFDKFEDLGFSGASLEILKKAQSLTQGMILVTGPTSSGKTTTLYVLLSHFNKPDVKIITLEDPIEYHLQGITQSQINEKRGYNFSDGLKSILRQDPDIVMIGEIRDIQTAEACAQAALTGHVLLSTLHTSSAVDAIPRLLTIGMPAFMISPALSVVVAQKLVRRLCASCAGEQEITDEEKKVLLAAAIDETKIPKTLKAHKGCEQCSYTGFRGQTVISEVLFADDDIKDAILKNKSAPEILAMAKGKGMVTMYEDAIAKVLAGITTLDEVHRAINA